MLTSCSAQPSAQSPFNGERAYADLERIVAIGPRVAGTEGSAKAQALIVSGLKEAGLGVREESFSAFTPMGVRSMKNIVGVVEGTQPGVIVLSNHYDTKYFRDINFVGANDGGSSTAWMLEMARVLGPKREGCTVWLVFFDGEEAFKTWSATDSVYGSREMVMRLKGAEALGQVKALINVDMIGDCDLGVMQDPGAPSWLTHTVWSTAQGLGYGKAFLPWGEAIEDDHMPFRRAGVPALELIDFRYGGDSLAHGKNWHTANDRLDKVCAQSLQVVGDVVYHSLARLDVRIASEPGE